MVRGKRPSRSVEATYQLNPECSRRAIPEGAAVGSQPNGEPGVGSAAEAGAETETGKRPSRPRRSLAKRTRRARGDKKPRDSDVGVAETAAAPEAPNSVGPSESGPDSAPRAPERIEAPDRSGQSDLPAAASSAGAPESSDGDDEDLPKRRGWWNRWV